MKKPWILVRNLFGLILVSSMCALVSGQATNSPCTGRAACAETAAFVASVTSFRTSSQPRLKMVATTVRIENRTDRPLILGYVKNSGIATDDQGNRYVVYGANGVRGIGEIAGNRFDSKFTVPAGASADARFELVWRPQRDKIFGSRFTLDLAIREIDPVANNQFRMGAEHALQFESLADGLTQQSGIVPAVAAGAATVSAPSSSVPNAPTSPAPDPCQGKVRCFHAGPFYAEVAQVSGARSGTYNDHVVRLAVRFHNVSAAPLILGYTSKSSVLIDNLGNRYYWGRAGSYDTSVTGMGIVTSGKANTSFLIAPGASRTATFQLIRYRPGNKPLGSSFTWDVAVEELEVLSSEQVRTSREFALHFENLSTGASAAEAVEKLKGIFSGRRK